MPAKRVPRLRPGRRLPAAVERLVAGLPIAESEENRELLISAAYFGDYSLTQPVRQRAADILRAWREVAEAGKR